MASLRVSWLDAERCLHGFSSFLVSALTGQSDSKIVVSLGIVGSQLDSLAQIGFGLLKIMQAAEHNPEIVVRLGIIWIEFQSTAELLDGQTHFAFLPKSDAQIVVAGCGFWICA